MGRYVSVLALALGVGLSAIASFPVSADAKSRPTLVSPAKLNALLKQAPSISQLPGDVQPSLTKAATTTGQYVAVAAGCTGYASLVTSPIKKCTFGDKSAKSTLVLVGDSHAPMWLPALDLIGKAKHLRVIALWKAGCGAVTLPFTPYDYSTGHSFPQCTQFVKWTIKEINALDPALVVISEQDGDGSPPPGTSGGVVTAAVWQSGLTKTLEAITSLNTEKVVLGDVDYLTNDTGGGPTCLAAHGGSVQRCSEPVAEATSSRYSGSDRAAASQAGARFIDVIPWLCSSVCTAIVQKTLVFADTGHLTTPMAVLDAGALESALFPPTPPASTTSS